MTPMLDVQLNLAESWLQLTETDTLVGAQGTGDKGIFWNN